MAAGEEAELVGGISVSLGASDAKLVGDLEAAERLVQNWASQEHTVILRARAVGGTAGGGGGIAAAGASQVDVQRMVTSGLVAVMRSPALPTLIQRIDRMRPTQVTPQAAPIQRAGRAAPPAFAVGPSVGTRVAAEQSQSSLTRAINAQLAQEGRGQQVDSEGNIIQATRQRRAAETPPARPTVETPQPIEAVAPTVNVDFGGLQSAVRELEAALGELTGSLTKAAEMAATAPSTGGGAARSPRSSAPQAGPQGAYLQRADAEKVEMVPVSVLSKIQGGNALGKTNIDELAESIKSRGFDEPLQLTYHQESKSATLDEGNHRLAAAIRAGLTDVPVTVHRVLGGQGTPVRGATPDESGYVPAQLRPSEIGVGAPPRGGRRRSAAPVAAAIGDEEDEAESRTQQLNRYGVEPINITGGTALGQSVRGQQLNRLGVQPLRMIGASRELGESIAAHRAQEGAARKAARDRDMAARRAVRDAAERQRQEAIAALPGLSAEQERLNNVPPTVPNPAVYPARTAANQTPEDRARAERNARIQANADAWNRGTGPFMAGPTGTGGQAAQRERNRAEMDREEDAAAQKQSRGGRSRTELQRERDIESNVARQRAAITASGRTGRTESFGLGALFGGTQGKFIEASQRQASARRELNRAEVEAQPIRERAAQYDIQIARTSDDVRRGYIARKQAFLGNRENAAILQGEVSATKKLGDANLALTKLQGPTSVARNLLAGAAGGAAFGVAMAAASEILKVWETALGPTGERLSGFSETTNKYTDKLSDAARAANGNVQAVTALKLASTGMAASTAATIQPLISQRAQVEAGNKALTDQIESLHVFENLRRSNAQAGITTTTGGFLGSPINGIAGTAEQVGNLFAQQGGALRSARGAQKSPLSGTQFDTRSLGDPLARFGVSNPALKAPTTASGAAAETAAAVAAAEKDFATSLELVNGQLTKGGDAAVQFVQGSAATEEQTKQTADAFRPLNSAMADSIMQNHLYATGIQNTNDALKALQAINIAGTIPDPAILTEQFNRADEAMVRALGRTQDYALKTQLPAQAALQNLAQPLLPVGTGIPGGAATGGQQKAVGLQKEINAYAAQGRVEIENTYKPAIIAAWGQAAGQAFQSQIDGIAKLGTEIAGLQAAMSNEQVVQQTKQYDYQLFIARRTLSDIGGLTGRNFGAGQSYLGVLEKQNLALSRQGQQLGFNLSQRQINFQTAVAGFQTPGVTPEERQARIAEAKIEAGFAQKQLDIQKQMFGNQVKIVDISNLRQGADLVKQIALLVSGRKVTIDIAVKQQELIKAQQRSEQLVAQAGKYLGSVDTIAATGISHIQDLETAAGRALTRTETKAVKLVSKFMADLAVVYSNFFSNNMENPTGGNAGSGRANNPLTGATGLLGSTSGATSMIVGEAGTETVAVLRNPRAMMAGMGGGSTVNFYGGVVVRQDSDIVAIARQVTKAMGRDAALKGLRSQG